MSIIDLTLTVPWCLAEEETVRLEELKICGQGGAYTGMVYHFSHDSMIGTYIDFPGHVKETDDGADAANYPLEKLFRVPATVIHLNREDGSGEVTASDLRDACPDPVRGGALVINALGTTRFDGIEEHTVWLSNDAVAWIIDTGIHLLISDIYESKALHGVFSDLFKAGVLTVCYPVNLYSLTAPYVMISALPSRFERVTQLPCRLLAEL